MSDRYILIVTGEREEIFEGEDALARVIDEAGRYLKTGRFQVQITKAPHLTGREAYEAGRCDPEGLLAEAKAGIAQILVPADHLVELIGRMRSVETMAYAKVALPRDEPREDNLGRWATIQQLERMGKEYFGDEFAGLMGACSILRSLFQAVRDGDWEGAESLVGSLDGGEGAIQQGG